MVNQNTVVTEFRINHVLMKTVNIFITRCLRVNVLIEEI